MNDFEREKQNKRNDGIGFALLVILFFVSVLVEEVSNYWLGGITFFVGLYGIYFIGENLKN